jgi:hypothetical protein
MGDGCRDDVLGLTAAMGDGCRDDVLGLTAAMGDGCRDDILGLTAATGDGCRNDVAWSGDGGSSSERGGRRALICETTAAMGPGRCRHQNAKNSKSYALHFTLQQSQNSD